MIVFADKKINVFFTFLTIQKGADFPGQKSHQYLSIWWFLCFILTGSSNETIALQGLQAVLKVFL
jgi:hypothetical protein